jgi:hypothetical protein
MERVIKRRKKGGLGAAALVGVLLCAVLTIFISGTAWAAGTGDNPKFVPDVLSAKELANRAEADAAYSRWLIANRTLLAAINSDSASSSAAQSIQDALRAPKIVLTAPASVIDPLAVPTGVFINTPSHQQERPYWCGPATVQVIHDWWGTPVSQQTYATHMGATPAGTIFSRVDDELRYRTGKAYYLRTLTSSTDFYSRVTYTLGTNFWPFPIDGHIMGGEVGYNLEHSGHIIPIEGYDWRYTLKTMDKNDVYNEQSNHQGGAYTYGHNTYNRTEFYSVVSRHGLSNSYIGA